MITNALIFIWTTVLTWALDMFPNYHLPTESINAIDTFFQVISPWDLIVPITEALSVIIIIMTIEIGLIVVKLFVGIVSFVRGSGQPDL